MHQRAICHDAIEFLHNYLSPGTGLPCLISSARTASARSYNRALFLADCSSLTNADGRGFAPLLPGGECPLTSDVCGCFKICCTLPASSRMICAPMVYLLSCLLHRQCFENRYSRTSAICSSVYVSASERIALRSLMICPLCVSG